MRIFAETRVFIKLSTERRFLAEEAQTLHSSAAASQMEISHSIEMKEDGWSENSKLENSKRASGD